MFDTECLVANCSLCDDDGQCLECQDPFSLFFSICIPPCDLDNCKICDDDTGCDVCEENFILNEDDECVPAGMYLCFTFHVSDNIP